MRICLGTSLVSLETVVKTRGRKINCRCSLQSEKTQKVKQLSNMKRTINDSVQAKRVLMYRVIGENRGDHDYSNMNASIASMENYIFLERRDFILSIMYMVFTVFNGYYRGIYLAVIIISPISPIFPSILVPFSLIWNHMKSSS